MDNQKECRQKRSNDGVDKVHDYQPVCNPLAVDRCGMWLIEASVWEKGTFRLKFKEIAK